MSLVGAKLLVDKAFRRHDRRKIELAHQLIEKARTAAKWFSIDETEIDPEEGLGSIVAWGSLTMNVSPPQKLTLYEKYIWRPLPELREKETGDWFGLDPHQDFIQVRVGEAKHAVKLASVETFRVDSGPVSGSNF